MKKLNCAEYQKGYFFGVQNNINIVMYKDKIFITQKLQRYIVQLYHTYLLHTGLEGWVSATFESSSFHRASISENQGFPTTLLIATICTSCQWKEKLDKNAPLHYVNDVAQ